MRSRVDPLGKLLQRAGALDEEALQDVLEHQRHTVPFASLCYVLGHLDEQTLAQALSRQAGIPGVVLDRSVILLTVLDGIDRDLVMTYNILPLREDGSHLFVAVEQPDRLASVIRELEFVRGKSVVPHIALQITLARTVRACYAARSRGEAYFVGQLADRHEVGRGGHMFVVTDSEERSVGGREALARDAVVDDVTSEVRMEELLSIEEPTARRVDEDGVEVTSRGPSAGRPGIEVIDLDIVGTSDLDASIIAEEAETVEASTAEHGQARVLIVDDDFASRHLLVKVFQPVGLLTMTASTGGEAIRILKEDPPDAIILDVMLPEIDGFQICRAIKRSRKYRHIPVILMSAVIDSGRVTDKVLHQYGADAYFEKPLNTDRIVGRMRDLLAAQRKTGQPRVRDVTFKRALELYRDGSIDGAISELRRGIEDDPLSAKHHFVLANLLHKRQQIYEAIDEYEATVDLRPDYFPALTRLAYLYYKQGFSAKAIETWRRSLPFCPDAGLRENIEVFMRKLIADLQSKA